MNTVSSISFIFKAKFCVSLFYPAPFSWETLAALLLQVSIFAVEYSKISVDLWIFGLLKVPGRSD